MSGLRGSYHTPPIEASIGCAFIAKKDLGLENDLGSPVQRVMRSIITTVFFTGPDHGSPFEKHYPNFNGLLQDLQVVLKL